MVDSVISCRDCGQSFAFSIGEQAFYARHGFSEPPIRCGPCRAVRKVERTNGLGGGGFANRGPQQLFQATCAMCGAGALVPFQPRADKPVQCTRCYTRQH
jgi:CxxC-x17-CxxC domain-containing protein